MSERPFSLIVKDIVGNLQEIVRSEVRLAKAEVREEANKAARASAFLMIGSFIGMYGFLFLLLAAAAFLAEHMPAWQALLVVFGVLAVIGGIFTAVGLKRLKQVKAPPSRTVKNVKENVKWAKEQIA